MVTLEDFQQKNTLNPELEKLSPAEIENLIKQIESVAQKTKELDAKWQWSQQ
jgi:hypothetical protein